MSCQHSASSPLVSKFIRVENLQYQVFWVSPEFWRNSFWHREEHYSLESHPRTTTDHIYLHVYPQVQPPLPFYQVGDTKIDHSVRPRVVEDHLNFPYDVQSRIHWPYFFLYPWTIQLTDPMTHWPCTPPLETQTPWIYPLHKHTQQAEKWWEWFKQDSGCAEASRETYPTNSVILQRPKGTEDPLTNSAWPWLRHSIHMYIILICPNQKQTAPSVPTAQHVHKVETQ